jgi:hypothetical protein
MSPQSDPLFAAEWAIAGMALRAIFGRAADPVDVVELRLSVTRETLPGLAVIEWEFIDRQGMAVAGGAL